MYEPNDGGSLRGASSDRLADLMQSAHAQADQDDRVEWDDPKDEESTVSGTRRAIERLSSCVHGIGVISLVLGVAALVFLGMSWSQYSHEQTLHVARTLDHIEIPQPLEMLVWQGSLAEHNALKQSIEATEAAYKEAWAKAFAQRRVEMQQHAALVAKLQKQAAASQAAAKSSDALSIHAKQPQIDLKSTSGIVINTASQPAPASTDVTNTSAGQDDVSPSIQQLDLGLLGALKPIAWIAAIGFGIMGLLRMASAIREDGNLNPGLGMLVAGGLMAAVPTMLGSILADPDIPTDMPSAPSLTAAAPVVAKATLPAVQSAHATGAAAGKIAIPPLVLTPLPKDPQAHLSASIKDQFLAAASSGNVDALASLARPFIVGNAMAQTEVSYVQAQSLLMSHADAARILPYVLQASLLDTERLMRNPHSTLKSDVMATLERASHAPLTPAAQRYVHLLRVRRQMHRAQAHKDVLWAGILAALMLSMSTLGVSMMLRLGRVRRILRAHDFALVD